MAKAFIHVQFRSELRSSVTVEAAVLGSNSPYGLCVRKAPLKNRGQELCVKVEVAVLGSPSLIVLTVSVDVKQH